MLTAAEPPSESPSPTETPSYTPSFSTTPTITPSLSSSTTHTPTVSPSPTLTPSVTRSQTVTPTFLPSPTLTPSRTPSLTVSVTFSATTSRTPTPTPTSHDAFQDAFVLSGAGNTVIGSNAGATSQANEARGYSNCSSSVWYVWTAPVTTDATEVVLTLTTTTVSLEVDVMLNLTTVVTGYRCTHAYPARFPVAVTSGGVYYFRVGSADGSTATDTFTLQYSTRTGDALTNGFPTRTDGRACFAGRRDSHCPS